MKTTVTEDMNIELRYNLKLYELTICGDFEVRTSLRLKNEDFENYVSSTEVQ